MSAATLRFHRPLRDITRDLDRPSSPGRYDELLDQWINHPEVVAWIAADDAICRLLDEHDHEVAV